MSENKAPTDSVAANAPRRPALRNWLKGLSLATVLTLTFGAVYKVIDIRAAIAARFGKAIEDVKAEAVEQAKGVGNLEQLWRDGSLNAARKLTARTAIIEMIRRDDVRSSSASACTTRPAPQHFKRAVDLLSELRDKKNAADTTALNGANLNGVNFDRLDLRRWSFRNACLVGASFRRSALDGAHFDGADMKADSLIGASVAGASFNRSARLTHARLDSIHGDSVQFHDAELFDANFKGAVIRFAIFRGANLECATLTGTVLDSADFADAVIALADFRGADTTGVRNLKLVARDTLALFPAGKNRGRDTLTDAAKRVVRSGRTSRTACR